MVSGDIDVKGIIVSTFDLSSEISFPIIKVGNFQGIRKTQINTKANPQEIIDTDWYTKRIAKLQNKL